MNNLILEHQIRNNENSSNALSLTNIDEFILSPTFYFIYQGYYMKQFLSNLHVVYQIAYPQLAEVTIPYASFHEFRYYNILQHKRYIIAALSVLNKEESHDTLEDKHDEENLAEVIAISRPKVELPLLFHNNVVFLCTMKGNDMKSTLLVKTTRYVNTVAATSTTANNNDNDRNYDDNDSNNNDNNSNYNDNDNNNITYRTKSIVDTVGATITSNIPAPITTAIRPNTLHTVGDISITSNSIPHAKVRIGFVSAHFRRHSVCKLFCGLISGNHTFSFHILLCTMMILLYNKNIHMHK
jgi:hypothetical protein